MLQNPYIGIWSKHMIDDNKQTVFNMDLNPLRIRGSPPSLLIDYIKYSANKYI